MELWNFRRIMVVKCKKRRTWISSACFSIVNICNYAPARPTFLQIVKLNWRSLTWLSSDSQLIISHQVLLMQDNSRVST